MSIQHARRAIRLFFFFTHTATTEFYTLSLHDALPISADSLRATSPGGSRGRGGCRAPSSPARAGRCRRREDRKSTRLNSSHRTISYAVFCLKKKTNQQEPARKQSHC